MNVHRPIFIITILSAALVLLGAGCLSKTSKTVVNNTATSAAEVVKKKPQIDTSANPAYAYCKKTGNELIIRFNETTSSSVAYCRFVDTTECEAEKFFKQTCAPGQGAKTYALTEKNNNFAACTNEYEPICGANGITYTNTCLAQVQGIIISHTGVCAPTEQKQVVIENKNSTAENTSKNAEKIAAVDNQNTSDPSGWLGIIKDFALSAPKSNPPAFIEKCAYSGNTTYYFSPGCDGCATTLYNQNGNIICYPSNDLDNTCPAYFTGAYRANYCSKTWQDNRP
ncbi:MAG: DUF333 domain-containing protein [Candidatus Magasanikbacteria bacterium]|nr:DUF333 domain-containing protein [Candidatus Magasanikbacteria bacterium]